MVSFPHDALRNLLNTILSKLVTDVACWLALRNEYSRMTQTYGLGSGASSEFIPFAALEASIRSIAGVLVSHIHEMNTILPDGLIEQMHTIVHEDIIKTIRDDIIRDKRIASFEEAVDENIQLPKYIGKYSILQDIFPLSGMLHRILVERKTLQRTSVAGANVFLLTVKSGRET